MSTSNYERTSPKVPTSSVVNLATALDLRMQSAMVLFAFEQTLGAYVTENTVDINSLPAGVRQNVAERVFSPSTTPSIHQLVQSTYISEILDMAISVSLHVSDHPHLKRLRELCELLRVYDIRNAVCHPNRPFPESYWHRMATLATDVSTDALQLRPVVTAFRSAQEGRLTPRASAH